MSGQFVGPDGLVQLGYLTAQADLSLQSSRISLYKFIVSSGQLPWLWDSHEALEIRPSCKIDSFASELRGIGGELFVLVLETLLDMIELLDLRIAE